MSIQQQVTDSASLVSLELLPYHTAMINFLKRSEHEVWNWFAARRMTPRAAEEVRFELLKSTYRVERELQPELYLAAEQVAHQIGISAPLTIHQAQKLEGHNAALAYVPGEVHLVLHGPVATQLSPAELRCLLAHELAHYMLWDGWNHELLLASDVLQALVTDAQAHSAHFASWRLFRLYSEIFCDRASLFIMGDLPSAIAALVKVETGVSEIHAPTYLRQAEEIFAGEEPVTEGVTHPETLIRVRALSLWQQRHPEYELLITRMIEGQPQLDRLDLLGQERVAGLTRRILDSLLWRGWFQTDAVLAHARRFFEHYEPPESAVADAVLSELLQLEPTAMHEYYCFVLLDFVTADRRLEELPLAAALALAEQCGFKPQFVELARQELKLRKGQLDRIDDEKATILAAAEGVAVK